MSRDEQDVLNIGVVRLIPHQLRTVERRFLLVAQGWRGETQTFSLSEASEQAAEGKILIRLPVVVDGS